jgi:hypothetical protein
MWKPMQVMSQMHQIQDKVSRLALFGRNASTTRPSVSTIADGVPFYLRYSAVYFTHYKIRCTPQDEIALCHML